MWVGAGGKEGVHDLHTHLPTPLVDQIRLVLMLGQNLVDGLQGPNPRTRNQSASEDRLGRTSTSRHAPLRRFPCTSSTRGGHHTRTLPRLTRTTHFLMYVHKDEDVDGFGQVGRKIRSDGGEKRVVRITSSMMSLASFSSKGFCEHQRKDTP